MLQTLAWIALLVGIFSVSADHANVPGSQAAPRPVRDITERASASQVDVQDFNFHEPSLRSSAPIEGEPVVGEEYVVEAHVEGVHAISTMKFEMADETGTGVAPVAVGRHTKSGFPRYVGVMTVPAHPFRIVLSGQTINGEPFRRVDRRVFRPIDRAAPRPRPVDAQHAAMMELLERVIVEQGPRQIAEVKADLASNRTGVIVIPRMDVSNVTYAPLVSAQGRPIGLKIAYDVRFSESGQFNPALGVEARYDNEQWRSKTRLTVFDSTITPMPRESVAPFGPVILNYIRTSPLVAGATYTYEEGPVYHFTADLVPDFVIHNLDRSKTCIYYQQYRHSPWSQKPFAEILAHEGLTSYSVAVGDRTGLIESAFSEGTFHRSFVAEGAQDCGPAPTRRF